MNQRPGTAPAAASDSAARLHYSFAAVAIGLLLAPFLINAFHAMPSSDDFCYAAQTDKAGYLDSIKHYYTNVNGRYFATFLIVTLDRLFPIERAYAAVPLFFFTAVALAFSALFRAIAPAQSDWRFAVTLGLMSGLVLISNTNAVAEVFYWLSASATYLSATAFTLAALACMLALLRRDTRDMPALALTVCGALAAIAATGSLETAGPVLIAAGATAMILARLLSRPATLAIAVVAAAGALGLWLNLSSPGTATRAEVIALDAGKDMIDLVVIALRSVLWTSERLANWGTRASVWVVAVPLYWAMRDLVAVGGSGDRHRRAALWTGILGLFVLPYLAAIPMFYAYTVPYPERAQSYVDVFCLLFWLAVIPFGFAAVQKAVALQGLTLNHRHLSFGLFAAFFVTVAGTWNFHHASLDTLRGIAYARQAAAQIGEVASHPDRAREIVVTRRRGAYAPTLEVSDITPDPRRWRNVCFAEFLGARGVRVEVDEDNLDFEFKPEGWIDPDPQATGRPRPPWPGI